MTRVKDIRVVEAGDALVLEAKVRHAREIVVVRLVSPVNAKELAPI